MKNDIFERLVFFDASESADTIQDPSLKRKLARRGRLEPNPTTQVEVDEETKRLFEEKMLVARQQGY